MKKTAVLTLALCCAAAWSQTYVAPHVRKDGTFVQGHYRSTPNSTPYDNYSSQGNSNPFTGERGTVNPYQYSAPQYQAPSYQVPTFPVCGTNSRGQYICR